MKQEMVGDVPGKVLGMLADLMHKLQQGVITVRELALFLQRKNPFSITDIRQEWQEFYWKYFRLTVDFSDVVIPTGLGIFNRVILIPKGLSFAQVVKALRKQFKMQSYTENLDERVIENVRIPAKNYAIRISGRQEADEELKNLSANQLKERGIDTITFLEHLLFELKYYSETKSHLDISNWTLCSGSRGRDGHVPSCGWCDDGLHVRWRDADDRDDSLRGREVR